MTNAERDADEGARARLERTTAESYLLLSYLLLIPHTYCR
jgi:hypothetical protein